MELRLLGPVEASADGRPVPLGAAKQRAVLAMLALHANRPVPADELAEGLWEEPLPASAPKMVQQYVSHLRRALPDGDGDGARILTRGRTYELRIPPDAVDAVRFERLLDAGAPREALALWRGPPLADLAGEPFAPAEVRRLEELRLTALERAVDDDLADGRHREIAGDLERLAREHPLRERLHGQLMLALYRSGRQADALAAYRRAREVLVEEIGVEPGPDLRALHAAILRQDPALAGPAAPGLPPELEAAGPLVGREAELAVLHEAWDTARGGRGVVVLLGGPEGIGRTRLAAELAGEVHRQGARVTTDPAALDEIHATRRPTLVVVDPLGPGTAERLAPLAREPVGAPVLVLAVAGDGAPARALPGARHLVLAPLPEDDVAALGALYAPAGVPVPAADLAERSGGIPARVHRLAASWAREAAARRLREAAARTVAGRRELRRAEAQLAGDVEGLRATRDRAEPGAPGRALVACPFKGLASFDVQDAPFFFGRERLVADMVARMAGSSLLGIVGPSGSGKSSALRAGLLPELTAGVLPGSDGRRQIVMRPGEHPMGRLRQALAQPRGPGGLLVAVDQFEELFTLCADEGERAAFADALAVAAGGEQDGAVVVLAVRADFYGRCADHPALARLLGANHVLVGPMRRDELRRAIEQSARAGGLRIDPELVDRLVADVEDEPGALPLLSSALLELWQQRDGRHLRLTSYEQVGGVRGAVARLAEGTWERLAPDERPVARAVLLRLAGEDVGGEPVRRPVTLEELEAGRDHVRRVLETLAAGRLVTLSQDRAEVAHEALLREWPRLRGWLEEDAEGRRLQHHLVRAAREWEASGRDRAELLRGARLASTLDWSAGHPGQLNAVERDLLEASRAEAEAEARRARRTNTRLRALLGGVAGLLALAVAAGALFFDQRGEARDRALTADAERLGAQALVEEDLDRALLLARQGVALEDTAQTRSSLLAALLRSPAAIGVVRSEGDRLLRMALHPDGRTLVVGDNRGRLLLLDVRGSGRPRAPRRIELGENTNWPVPSPQVLDLEFSPDGTRLAVSRTGKIELLDGRTWEIVAAPDVPRRGYLQLAFSPDGQTLLAPSTFGPTGPETFDMLRLSARTGRRLGSPERIGPGGGDAFALAFSRDGRRFAAREGDEVVVRDARTLRAVHRVPGGTVFPGQAQGDIDLGVADAVALGPDGTLLAAGGEEGAVRFVDLRTGRAATASGRHEGAVTGAQFSLDGDFLVTLGDDADAIVWDVERRAAGERLEGHAGRLLAAALDERARTLHTAGLDSGVITWDLVGDRRLGRPFDAGRGIGAGGAGYPATAISPDGRTLVTDEGGGRLALVDASSLSLRRLTIAGSRSPVNAPAFVAGGRLAVAGYDGLLALVDPRTGSIERRLRGHRDVVFTPQTSADGRVLVTTGLDATLRLWDARTGRALGPPTRLDGPPGGHAKLSPDGRIVAVPLETGTIDVYDAASRRRVARVGVDGGPVLAAGISPDGRLLTGGSADGRVRVFATEDWRPLGRAFEAHSGFVFGVEVSPDGRRLLTSGTDGQVRLWDRETQRPIGAPLPGPQNVGAVAFFAPGGTHAYAVFANGRGYRWDVRAGAWTRHACAAAGRRLTRREWGAVLPGRAYAPAC